MLRRHIIQNLRDALADTPVVFLGGARQTGKSTLARHLVETGFPGSASSPRYLTLDDATVLAAAQADPDGFVRAFDEPVVIDEVQRAPELFRAIKAEVDRDRRPGRFLLTGSANVLLLPNLSESLAGRMEVLTLWPFSQGELEGREERFVDALFGETPLPKQAGRTEGPGLWERVLRGGYPEVVARPTTKRRRAWFNAYVTTLLQRDVRDLANIEGLTQMPRLLALLAARTASLLNYSEISRASGLPLSTLRRYLTLLEATFLVQVLPAWSANLSKRLVKTPKVLLSDTGLAAQLVGLSEVRAETDRTLLGALLENFVVTELRKQATWSERQPSLYHFRLQAGSEVDLVLEDAAGALVGVEVKAGASVGSSDFKGLRALAAARSSAFRRGIVLYAGEEVMRFGPNLEAVPIDMLWQG